MTEGGQREAQDPEDLPKLFNQRANAGDIEGLVALYEPEAVLAIGSVAATGHDQIRRFYKDLLAKKSDFPQVDALPSIQNGNVALTFGRASNGALSIELARRQADGEWLWAVDQLKLESSSK